MDLEARILKRVSCCQSSTQAAATESKMQVTWMSDEEMENEGPVRCMEGDKDVRRAMGT